MVCHGAGSLRPARRFRILKEVAMRVRQLLALLVVICCGVCGPLAASTGPDGQQIAFVSDLAGRTNLWKVNASGGWPIQLTQSDDRQYSPVWSPDGQWIVYEQDRAGDELWDLYAIPSDGGEIVNLTNTPAIREQDPHWSHNGRTIAFDYKTKDGAQYDIALLDWSTRKIQKMRN